MKIYTNSELTNEITVLDFGTLDAGETKKYTFYIQNDSSAYIKELEFNIEHNELEILKAPEELLAKTVGELVIEWKANVTLREGLRAQLHIKGKELWG